MSLSSTELERCILGCILVSPATLRDVQEEGVVASDFSLPMHREMWAAILRAVDAGKIPDLTMIVNQEMERINILGGMLYVTDLAINAALPDAVQHYARQLRESGVRRQIKAAAEALLVKVGEESVDALLARVEGIKAIGQQMGVQDGWIALADAAVEVEQATQSRYEAARAGALPDLLGTGFRSLDEMLGGMEPGQLVVLAARPAMGKTAMALNIALHAAKSGCGVGIVSLEMQAVELARRAVSQLGKLPAWRMERGAMNGPRDWDAQATGVEVCQTLPVWIQDKKLSRISALPAMVRRLRYRAEATGVPLRLVVVDYLQLVGGEQGISDQERISEVSRSLKMIAGEERVVMLALSQLNRAVEERVNKMPTLSDLRGSGAIEQDADKVIGLYRGVVYHPSKFREDQALALVLKNRQGQIGEVELGWMGEHTTFKEIA